MEEEIKLTKVVMRHHGPAIEHNMPCPIYYDKHAVWNANKGHFEPSLFAQKEGWVVMRFKKQWVRKLAEWLER